jgi:hypothetical protein
MIKYCYDVECLKNFFSATFVNIEDENEKHVFYVGLGKEDWTDLLKFLKTEMTLIGYNNHSYDDPMLRFLMGYRGSKLTSDLYALSGKLIDEGFRNERAIMELRYPKKVMYPWKSIDLMRILAFDKLGISLKQTAINLKWYRIQDMPVEPDAHVVASQLELILDYNMNDVLITKKLYDEIKPLRELRDDLSKIYNVDLSSASKSRMANLILENIYGNEMKMDIRAIRDMRTKREKVFLGHCIAPFVKFQSPILREMLDRITAEYVWEYNGYKYSEEVYFANCKFMLGIGGLHTVDQPGVFVSDENFIIQDMDGSSYYPNLIINNKFYPEHLGIDFIKVLKRITDERMTAKKIYAEYKDKGEEKDPVAQLNKVKAEGLKITANSIFGKFGSDFFWLQDAKQLLSTTLSGQMGLLMLVEGMHANGIPVISCNTDGIVCKIPKDKIDRYYEIARAWEKATGISLEFTRYKKYVRRDVNSYIAEKEDGTTKEKGAFLKYVDLEKAYHMPIVGKALSAYFIKGIPVRKTLEECKDIMDFCVSQKSGTNFDIELHTIKGIEKLQKTNRFYITKKGGRLVKRERVTKKMTGLYVGRMVRILNNYDSTIPFKDYAVDIPFYEKEVMKIVDAIEPKQISMFDMSTISQGRVTEMEYSRKPVLNEGTLLVGDLNKLGKNQLIKKIESIVNNNQKINKISPRYVYVLDFSSKTMTAELYCLNKAIKQIIAVDKTAYKKENLEKGSLVYCTKFEKRETGQTLVEYKLTSKLEEQKDRLMQD